MSCYLPEELVEREREVGAQSERQALLQREIQEADARLEGMYGEMENLRVVSDGQVERIRELEKMVHVRD